MAVRQDFLAHMNNLDGIKRYRFDHQGLQSLHNLLSDQIQPVTARHSSLSAMEKILITLRFLASGEYQLNDADLHGVSQPTVSRAINEVVTALSSPGMIRRFVRFNTTVDELDQQVQQFNGLAGFPKVVGVIDGTHVKIMAPSVDEDMFVNRKGTHSINVQLVFDSSDTVIDVVARWPGSTHDSRILHNSGLRQIFEQGVVPAGYHLLGDSGYPCRRWLLTPYLNPAPGAQSAYNRYKKIW